MRHVLTQSLLDCPNSMWNQTLYLGNCWRPYHVECTGSLLTSEVKRHRARLVLGWGTAWEDLRVLPAQNRLKRTGTGKERERRREEGKGEGKGKGKGKKQRQRQRQRPAGPCLFLCLFLLISKSRDFLHLHVKAGPSKYLWVALSLNSHPMH